MSDKKKTLAQRWEARDEIKDRARAMDLAADKMAAFEGVTDNDFEMFCAKHKIPFDYDLLRALHRAVDDLNDDAIACYHEDYEGPEEYVDSVWLSSSAYC